MFDALTAIEHAETPSAEGVRLLTSHDTLILTAILGQVDDLLKASLDQEWLPHGPAAEAILDEAALPSALSDGSHDRDRVFEITAEGRVALQHSRISLPELYERLPEVASFLRRAAEREENVLVDD